MSSDPAEERARLVVLALRLAARGASLTVEVKGMEPVRAGPKPDAARVTFHAAAPLEALLSGDHLGVAEAYLAGEIDIAGDWLEVMTVTELLSLAATPLSRARLLLRRLAPGRLRYDREAIEAHYDRPLAFFEPWLGRARCYSHGLYDSADESIDVAMERKMQHAIDTLGLEAGMHVFDMGGGWGTFVEYAGLRGIHVHAITLSGEQHRYVTELIRRLDLPCSVELVHFKRYAPSRRFDAAVFMGTFEHNPEYAWAARWLAEHLAPGGRVWADFCAQRSDFTIGAFMKKHIWPGPITYVRPHHLVGALVRAGFNIHEMADDTESYALTVRDWGDALEENREALAERFGEPAVRAFLLFLRGSWRFLLDNRTQAYHLVAGLSTGSLSGAARSSNTAR